MVAGPLADPQVCRRYRSPHWLGGRGVEPGAQFHRLHARSPGYLEFHPDGQERETHDVQRVHAKEQQADPVEDEAWRRGYRGQCPRWRRNPPSGQWAECSHRIDEEEFYRLLSEWWLGGMKPRMFGTIERLPSKRYRAYYKHEGRRVYAQGTFRHQADASAWLANTETDLGRGTWADPHRGQETFQQYAGTWMKRTDLADSTRGKYEGCSGRTPCRVRQGRAAPAGRSGQHGPRVVLRARPAVPGRPTANDAYRCLRIDAAVAAIATRYKAGYAIAAWCQLRRGEIPGLRRMDIDVKREQYRSGSTGSCPREPPGPC